MQKKIFVSYTLRGNKLSKIKLNNLKDVLNMLDFLIVYIDAFDNNNIVSPQIEVINRLLDADIVWVIYSDDILKSEWVLKEIQIAEEHNKIIHYMSVETIDSIILARDNSMLLNLIQAYI